jgi:putative ABC transport system substrate-binding protein
LTSGFEDDHEWQARFATFREALEKLGWAEGRNIRMDLRWGGDNTNRMRALAQELVGLQPDIILAGGTQVTIALQRETRTIPIVFANVPDPVAQAAVRNSQHRQGSGV